MSPDERAIRELVERWMTASCAGDDRDRAQPDVGRRRLHGSRPRTVRQANLRRQFAQHGRARLEGKADIRELTVIGGWAYLRNFIEITITPPGGEGVRRSGYTLSILRKEADGKWLLARDANLVS